jgi:Bacterial Ig-like domain (group 3)
VLLIVLAAGASPALSQSVTTYHYDNYRTGWNWSETILTPAIVSSSYFGYLQSVTLDDQVDSQPLYMHGVNITAGLYQGTHDVVYVATESNTVYAIDAESGTVLLNPNFGAPIPLPLGCNNNGPNVGINSTPVIDSASNTLYVMVYTQQSGDPAYYLHALDLGSLTDKVSPQLVTGSRMLTDGTIFNFNATYQRQRPALLLANGNIYAGFGSFCDYSPSLSRGWLLGWQAGTLTPIGADDVFDIQATSPNSFFLSSIWMSGFGPSADDSGNILVTTGNSDPSGTTYDGVTNLQESVVKVSPDLTAVLDLFTPSNWAILDQLDEDLGSGGVMVLPDQPGSIPHLAVAGGKPGTMYLMNEDALGGYSSGSNNVLGSYMMQHCWCGPAYFVDPKDSLARVVSSGDSTVMIWKLQSSPTPSLTLVATSNSLSTSSAQDPGFFTSVSSNGTSNPIVWAISRPTTSDLNVYLYAFDPDSGGKMTTLFRGAAGTWPNTGGNANLVPIVANGQVFVGSYAQLQIFGLTGTATTTTLTPSQNPSLYGQSLTLTANVQPAATAQRVPAGPPTGTATFKDGATILGTANLNNSGNASLAISTLAAGTSSLTAVYNGDSNYVLSTSAILLQTVNPASTTTSLAASTNASEFNQPVVLTATVNSATGATTTGSVTFEDGTNTLGTIVLASGTATLSVSGLGVRTHSITAVYAGNTTFIGSTSTAISVTVSRASTTTTLASTPNPSSGGQAVTFTATVTPAYGGSPTAPVTFIDGITTLGSVGVNATTHQATLVISTLAAGTHNVVANFVGGLDSAPSSSAAVAQTVNPE